jgi:hypothetical protein
MADTGNDTSSSTKIGVGSDSEMLSKQQKESATGAIRKMFDDTRTRKAVRGEVLGTQAPPKELSPMDDPMNVRNTDTGNLKRMMENTKTRKTVKLKPLSGQKPVQLADENETPAEAATKAKARQTIKLKAAPKPSDAAEAEKLAKSHDEAIAKANARQTVKLKAVPPVTAPIPKATPVVPKATPVTPKATPVAPKATVVSAGETKKIDSDTAAPADPLKKRDSNTGTMKKMLDNTQTRKTVKLKKTGANADQQAETVVEGIDTSTGAALQGGGVKGRSSQTQKFKARQTQRLKGGGKKRKRGAVPGAKDTIKLRPSGGDKAAQNMAKENAKKQTIRMAPVQKTDASDTIKLTKKPTEGVQKTIPAKTAASDTIKLTKKPTEGVKKAIPAKTAGVQKAKVVGAKAAKVVGDEILATDTAKASAMDSGVKKAKVIQQAKFSAETANTIKLDDAGAKSGLRMPKRTSAPKKPTGAPTAPTQKLSIPTEGDMELPKSGGLKVKKVDAPSSSAGAPMAQKGEEEFGSAKELKKKAKKANSGDASIFYTILAVASLILLSAAAFISAAQYINLWEQQRVGQEISVPMINDFINKIGE